MPRSQHLVAERVVPSYAAHRHAAPLVVPGSRRPPGTTSATIAATAPRRLVWTWRPIPDTGGLDTARRP